VKLGFLWRLSICIRFFLKVTQYHPNFFNQLFKSALHEKLNDWKMTSKTLCIFLFLHDLFAICGFSQCPPHGWLCLHFLGKSQFSWWLGRRVLSLRTPGFEWTASAGPTLTWRHKVAGSIDPPSHISSPPSSPKGRGEICVPNILTSANHLEYFKEAVGRNLPRAAGQPELDNLEISKMKSS
jgi:hypothetical protein